ncbi:MAG: ribokinase [Rubripirellula sp.]|nr:ribokinase [Rubripirellula sp.]
MGTNKSTSHSAVRPKVAVLGSINMDLVVRCDELPEPGQTIMANSSTEFCGGKGANQAVAASLAGGDVNIIGAVGNDAFAKRLMDNLRHHSIGCNHVLQRSEHPSGLAIISVDQRGQNSIMVVAGSNGTLSAGDVQSVEAIIQDADVLLVQLETPVDAILAGIKIANQAGVKVILDPAPALKSIPPDLLNIDLLCPNESEAAALTGQKVASVDDAISAAIRLQQMGSQNVAITLGDRGTLLHTCDETTLVPAFEIDAVDTTAAGDAFAGSVAVRWLQTGNLQNAVRFANAAGALTASKHGAQASMPSHNEIESLWRSR